MLLSEINYLQNDFDVLFERAALGDEHARRLLEGFFQDIQELLSTALSTRAGQFHAGMSALGLAAFLLSSPHPPTNNIDLAGGFENEEAAAKILPIIKNMEPRKFDEYKDYLNSNGYAKVDIGQDEMVSDLEQISDTMA